MSFQCFLFEHVVWSVFLYVRGLGLCPFIGLVCDLLRSSSGGSCFKGIYTKSNCQKGCLAHNLNGLSLTAACTNGALPALVGGTITTVCYIP